MCLTIVSFDAKDMLYFPVRKTLQHTIFATVKLL